MIQNGFAIGDGVLELRQESALNQQLLDDAIAEAEADARDRRRGSVQSKQTIIATLPRACRSCKLVLPNYCTAQSGAHLLRVRNATDVKYV